MLKVCCHEAGHYVIGRCNGFKTGDCVIKVLDKHGHHNGGCEIKLYRPLPTQESLVAYVEDRIRVLYAGAFAESMVGHKGVDNDSALKALQFYGAQDDNRKASELTQLLRNALHHEDVTEAEVASQLKGLCDRLYNESAAQVLEEAKVINAVGRYISSVVKELGVEYKIPGSELDQLPAVVARFAIQ